VNQSAAIRARPPQRQIESDARAMLEPTGLRVPREVAADLVPGAHRGAAELQPQAERGLHEAREDPVPKLATRGSVDIDRALT
jgi:hypothetical protein